MADPTVAEKEPAAPPAEPPAGSAKSTLVIRVAALLFVVAVILAECLIAYRLLSGGPEGNTAEASSTSVEAEATKGNANGPPGRADSGRQESDHGKIITSIDPLDEGSPSDLVGPMEVDLGQFTVTTHQPAANTTVRIDFHLYGIIAGKSKEEFEKAMKGVHQRFREQVLVTVRGAEGSDLADAGLGLIKRQILEKSNALLGKPFLRAVIISDFSYMEQ
jgi:flagellar FliL protein